MKELLAKFQALQAPYKAAVIVAPILALSCLCCCPVSWYVGKDQPRQVAKATDQPKEEPKKKDELPTMTGQTHEIYNHYLQNEVGAKASYHGKLMVVSGNVWEVRADGAKKAIVVLACADLSTNPPGLNTSGAFAFFDEASEVAGLKREQQIFFIGRCDGTFLGSVNFRGCKMVPADVLAKVKK